VAPSEQAVAEPVAVYQVPVKERDPDDITIYKDTMSEARSHSVDSELLDEYMEYKVVFIMQDEYVAGVANMPSRIVRKEGVEVSIDIYANCVVVQSDGIDICISRSDGRVYSKCGSSQITIYELLNMRTTYSIMEGINEDSRIATTTIK
jgi:hypothetical protein